VCAAEGREQSALSNQPKQLQNLAVSKWQLAISQTEPENLSTQQSAFSSQPKQLQNLAVSKWQLAAIGN
jgi:hypothetical protein